MKIITGSGLFPPGNVDWVQIRDRGYMDVLYHEESDTAELIEDEKISMRVADIATEKTDLEMITIAWD